MDITTVIIGINNRSHWLLIMSLQAPSKCILDIIISYYVNKWFYRVYLYRTNVVLKTYHVCRLYCHGRGIPLLYYFRRFR